MAYIFEKDGRWWDCVILKEEKRHYIIKYYYYNFVYGKCSSILRVRKKKVKLINDL